jgi:hypothetical protein
MLFKCAKHFGPKKSEEKITSETKTQMGGNTKLNTEPLKRGGVYKIVAF